MPARTPDEQIIWTLILRQITELSIDQIACHVAISYATARRICSGRLRPRCRPRSQAERDASMRALLYHWGDQIAEPLGMELSGDELAEYLKIQAAKTSGA